MEAEVVKLFNTEVGSLTVVYQAFNCASLYLIALLRITIFSVPVEQYSKSVIKLLD